MLPFVTKYQPKLVEDVVGHGSVVDKVRTWIGKWKKGEPQKPLLMHGQAGVGKTSLVEALVTEYNLELLEMNASDTRTSKAVNRIAGFASSSATFSKKMRLILFDEVDGLYLQDRGGSASINKILQNSICPIILTANDAWSKKLTTIRKHCDLIEVRKVHSVTISKLLKKIADEEEIKVDDETLLKLAKNSQGDVRSAINDFEFLASVQSKEIVLNDVEILSQRDKSEKSMFNVVRNILKGSKFSDAVAAVYNLSERPDFILQWVCENVPKEYTKPKDLHSAFEYISRADIYLGRVYRRQNYGFWRYANVMMTAGVALSKDSPYHGFVRYQYPSGISYLARSKTDRKSQKKVAKKIGKFCHVSTKVAVADYLPMFFEVMKNDNTAVSFSYQMNFDEEDLNFLYANYPKQILKQVEEMKNENIKKHIAMDRNQKSLNKFF